MKIFLAYSFCARDKSLVGDVDRLISSHWVDTNTGRRLDGGKLSPEIQRRIEECECLVALLTRREPLDDRRWTTHSWVLDELTYARAKNRHAIALVEDGVELSGMHSEHEHIRLEHANPAEAFLQLSETIGSWRRQVGRRIKIQISPDAAAAAAVDPASAPNCEYRLWSDGKPGAWVKSDPVREIGGTFVYLDGARDDHAIELRVVHRRKRWESDVTSQWMTLQLKGRSKQQ